MIEFIIKHLEFIINIFVSLFSGIIGSILGVVVARNYQITETLRIEFNKMLLVIMQISSADKYTVNELNGETIETSQHIFECSLLEDLNNSKNSLELLIDNLDELNKFKRLIKSIKEELEDNLKSWSESINNNRQTKTDLFNRKIHPNTQINTISYNELLLKLRNDLKEQLQKDNNKFKKIYSEFLNDAKNYINKRSKILFPIKRLIKCQ